MIPEVTFKPRESVPEIGPRCRSINAETGNKREHRTPAMNSEASPAGPVKRQSMASARLRKHADYQRAYAAGRKKQSASMSWFLAPQSLDDPRVTGPRVGLTVGKVLGMAHDRNRIKRRLREVLRRHVDLLPVGVDLILHPRRTVLSIEFTKLEAEVVRILQQSNADAARFAQNSAAQAANVAKPEL